jgi:PAS domain S-box-containing protein
MYADLYSEIYDFTPIPYFTFDKSGKILELNLAASKFFGIERSFLISKKITNYLQPKAQIVVKTFLNGVFEQRSKTSDEFYFLRKNAPLVIAYFEGTLSEKENKCHAMLINITERRYFETQLRDSRDKMNMALENASIGIWELDLNTEVMIWDERMERIFGLSPGTYDGTFASFLNYITEDDIPYVKESFRISEAKNTPFEAVFKIINNNGEIRYLNSKALIYKDKPGGFVKMSGVCFDVTGMQKGVEKTLFKLNQDLRRSNRDLESFAYVASHDLQEPLRMVSSFTQLLADHFKETLDEDVKDYIRFAVDGAKRMSELIYDLLTYSRIQSTGREFSRVDMNIVLENVIQNLSIYITEKNATITSDKLPVILADEYQMGQLMQNLVNNAMKFSNLPPKIYISCKDESERYIFSVKDNGIGIEREYFERIFKMFQRLSDRETYEGNGIGLAICKRIVERHGGDIWVESEPGKGTIFHFTLSKDETPKEL